MYYKSNFYIIRLVPVSWLRCFWLLFCLYFAGSGRLLTQAKQVWCTICFAGRWSWGDDDHKYHMVFHLLLFLPQFTSLNLTALSSKNQHWNSKIVSWDATWYIHMTSKKIYIQDWKILRKSCGIKKWLSNSFLVCCWGSGLQIKPWSLLLPVCGNTFFATFYFYLETRVPATSITCIYSPETQWIRINAFIYVAMMCYYNGSCMIKYVCGYWYL